MCSFAGGAFGYLFQSLRTTAKRVKLRRPGDLSDYHQIFGECCHIFKERGRVGTAIFDMGKVVVCLGQCLLVVSPIQL